VGSESLSRLTCLSAYNYDPRRANCLACRSWMQFGPSEYTILEDPLATQGTAALGINATGQIVGYYATANVEHGFLYSGGTYTTLDDPLANGQTQAI
jgi:probable HAF family extracellular repeat protein